MIVKTLPLAALLAAGPAFAQAATQAPAPSDLPDCRTISADAPHGTRCTFPGAGLPAEEYLGTISLPSDDHTKMFGVPGPPPPPGGMHHGFSFDLAALFTFQGETFNERQYAAQGFKINAHKQWSDLRGLEIRGDIIRFDAFSIGADPGNDHTEAVTAGPRIQHAFGRFTPYFTPQLGLAYQIDWAMSVGAAAGAEIKLSKHWSWNAADLEYRWAAFQDSTATYNPRRGRIELSTGVVYHFGA